MLCGARYLPNKCRSMPRTRIRESTPVRQIHGPETAGRLALRSFPTGSPADFAATIRDRLTRGSHEILDLVLVTDSAGHYQGVVELRHILQAPKDQSLAALMRTDWPTVLPETDQEHAVEAASRGRVAALPVVTRDGRPVGILSPRTLLEVLGGSIVRICTALSAFCASRPAPSTPSRIRRCGVQRGGCHGC